MLELNLRGLSVTEAVHRLAQLREQDRESRWQYSLGVGWIFFFNSCFYGCQKSNKPLQVRVCFKNKAGMCCEGRRCRAVKGEGVIKGPVSGSF